MFKYSYIRNFNMQESTECTYAKIYKMSEKSMHYNIQLVMQVYVYV